MNTAVSEEESGGKNKIASIVLTQKGGIWG
jgi:hypothetical protein